MRLFAALLLGAAVGPVFAAGPASSPLDQKAAEWDGRGFSLKDRVEKPLHNFTLAAATYVAKDGSADRFETYVVLNGKVYLGYSHPAQTERLEIDESSDGRGFRDLFKDGSRVIAYRSTIRALNASSLNVLSYKSFKFRRRGEFPEGRFLRDGDELLILQRDLPLGRFLSVGCENFGTISQTAFRSRLYSFNKGGFVEATKRHPEFFAAEIQRKAAALRRLQDDMQKNAGEYLGLALSLYYDYAARGEARQGWDRQKELFQLPSLSTGKIQACLDTVRNDLRARLGIPTDWP